MKKILIIEDNKDVRENTADILELENYEVIVAENGKIGVEKAKQTKPDVILCDILMPELDGYGVLKALSSDHSTGSIPFIFLTAKTKRSDLRKGMNLGADDYLTKPFNDQELLDAIACRLKKNDFLKKEFSNNIDGFNEFLEEASDYMNLQELSKNYNLKKYEKKEFIYQEGAAAHNLYFIQTGTIKTYQTTESGKEFVTGIYGAGNYFGQLSLIGDNGTYVETATILDDVEVYEIPKVDFLKLIYGNKVVSGKFISMISNNLIEVQKKLMHMAFASVKQRTARALLDLHRKGLLTNKQSDGIHIAREDFAGIIGTASETAIRMLTEFKQQGLITIDTRRNIIIEDENKLDHIANFAE